MSSSEGWCTPCPASREQSLIGVLEAGSTQHVLEAGVNTTCPFVPTSLLACAQHPSNSACASLGCCMRLSALCFACSCSTCHAFRQAAASPHPALQEAVRHNLPGHGCAGLHSLRLHHGDSQSITQPLQCGRAVQVSKHRNSAEEDASPSMRGAHVTPSCCGKPPPQGCPGNAPAHPTACPPAAGCCACMAWRGESTAAPSAGSTASQAGD